MRAIPKWLKHSMLGAILGIAVWFPLSGFSPSQGVDLMTFIGLAACAAAGAGLAVFIDAIRTYKAFLITLVTGTTIVVAICAYAIMNPPQQCTWQSTQQEIAASHCII